MHRLRRLYVFIEIFCFCGVLNSSLSLSLTKDSIRKNNVRYRDENTCAILGQHASCTGTHSSRNEDQRTLAQLLLSLKLPSWAPDIQYVTIEGNVNLSSRNLHVLESLIELNISRNSVAGRTIDENFLSHFPRLTTLEIVKSDLTTLPVFRDRHASLVNLVLNNNAIQSWREASLRSLPNLRTLHLAGNNITELTADLFPPDYPLVELSVRDNRIGRIDAQVGTSRLKQLRVFQLDGNRLHLSLRQLSSHIQKCRPEIFPNFPSVELLDLSQNGLEFVPSLMFGEWTRLRELRLRRNRLEFFGPGAFYIEKGGLHQLDLSCNRVASVSAEVTYGLDDLVALNLTQNRIRSVQTDAFEKMKKLQQLQLVDNQLSFIGGIFDPLSSLEVLNLSCNPNLAQLPSNAFGGLHRLKELDLSNSSIHVIDDKVFEALNQLRNLSLANNRLAMIRGGYFSGLVGLVELDLRGNNIMGVEESESNDLKGMIFLKKLYLDTSHYHCGLCGLRAFVSWLRSKRFSEPDVRVRCASPPELRGLSVLGLQERQAANCEIGLVPKVISHPPSEAKLVRDNLTLVCTILSNSQPVVAWQRAPLPPDAAVTKPATSGFGVGVGVVSAARSEAGDAGTALIGRPVYASLPMGRYKVSLLRSDKEWRAQLHLTNLSTADSGLYRCSVTVGHQAVPAPPSASAGASAPPIRSLPATIRVLDPPRPVERPDRLYTVREGDTLEIPCSSSGQPKPEQSLRRSRLLNFPAAVERRLTLPGEGTAAPTRFGIRQLSGADTGFYLCIGENAVGRSEIPFEIVVLTRPRFVQAAADWPARLAVRPGGDLTLNCSASGNPQPGVAWFLGDRRLANESRAGQLRLASAVASDAGVYRCQAANSMGSVSRRVEVVVTDTEIPGSIDATTTATTSASDTSSTSGTPRPSFSLLVFAVVVSAMSCVLLTTLLWSVVFVFLRRKSRRLKRTLSQRLAEERAHREQLCRSEPALHQHPNQQLRPQLLLPPQRVPLMVASLAALPHSKSGGDIFSTSAAAAAGGVAVPPQAPPPLPPFHLHRQLSQHQPAPPPQHWGRRYGNSFAAASGPARRSEPDLLYPQRSQYSLHTAGNGYSNHPMMLMQQHQQQRSRHQLQTQQQPPPPQPKSSILRPPTAAPGVVGGGGLPPETSDYNTGSASSGDSVEHLRLQDTLGYARLHQQQQQQQQQLQMHGGLPPLGAPAGSSGWRALMSSSAGVQHHPLIHQYQGPPAPQHQLQQLALCTSFTGQRSPSSTDFDSGYEPSSSLARPRSSRSLFGVSAASVIAMRETAT